MIKKISILLLLIFSYRSQAQIEVFDESKNLILLYNYSHFSIVIPLVGKEIKKLDEPNFYLVDKKIIQIKIIKTSDFIKDTINYTPDNEVLNDLFKWETEYQKKQFSNEIGNFKVEYSKLGNGKIFITWSFDMPITPIDTITSEFKSLSVRKQVYIGTIVGKYAVMINSPYMKHFESLHKIRSYLQYITGSIKSYDYNLFLKHPKKN